jgi:hypothetical protein
MTIALSLLGWGSLPIPDYVLDTLELLCILYYIVITTTLLPLSTIPPLQKLLYHGKLLKNAAVRSATRSLSKSPRSATFQPNLSGTDTDSDLPSSPASPLRPRRVSGASSPVESHEGVIMRFMNAVVAPRVPKVWFAHFYIVALYVTGALWCLTGPSWVLTLFMGHLFRRYWEQCNFFSNSSSMMHTGHYLLGLSFYTVTPCALALAVARQRANDHYAPPGWLMTLLFLGFNFSQCAHHYFLSVTPKPHSGHGASSLITPNTLGLNPTASNSKLRRTPPPVSRRTGRRNSASDATPTPYRLPQRGLFRHVTCPHYFFEILIYLCLLWMCHGEKIMMWCFLWVFTNLTVSAGQSHAYYRAHRRARRYRVFMYIY